MHTDQRVIPIHLQAPPKPLEGQACNGCGVCCLAEPCPLGILMSGRRTGSCRILQWDDNTAQYRCGALVDPGSALRQSLPGVLGVLGKPLSAVLTRWARRWIAAGKGCDCKLETYD